MDIIIFSGQSNMQGQTESLPTPNEAVRGATEYRYLSDTLCPLAHPVGESISEGETQILLGAHEGHGSLIPAFCREYVAKSGKDVIAVQTAKGATKVSDWQPDTLRYGVMVKKILAAKRKAEEIGTIERILFVWLQGESDALEETTEDEYCRGFITMKDALKKDCGIEEFGIIQVGYFAPTVGWHTKGSPEDRLRADETILRAQERIVRENADCRMLTRICPEISRDLRYINPFEEGHFNNAAMDAIGTAAADGFFPTEKTGGI